MYYERLQKNSLLSYFIVALIAAIIEAVSMYIAPTFLYGKVLPTPGIYRVRPKEIVR